MANCLADWPTYEQSHDVALSGFSFAMLMPGSNAPGNSSIQNLETARVNALGGFNREHYC